MERGSLKYMSNFNDNTDLVFPMIWDPQDIFKAVEVPCMSTLRKGKFFFFRQKLWLRKERLFDFKSAPKGSRPVRKVQFF